MTLIEVGKDFSRTPGGRKYSDGPDSGEMFRERFLVPALERAKSSNQIVTVVLDGTRGYLSSFLEEAFGGLVRFGYFTKDELKNLLVIEARNSFYDTYKRIAEKAIDQAKREAALAS